MSPLEGAGMIMACIRESGLFKNILVFFCFTNESIIPTIDVAN